MKFVEMDEDKHSYPSRDLGNLWIPCSYLSTFLVQYVQERIGLFTLDESLSCLLVFNIGVLNAFNRRKVVFSSETALCCR